MSTPYQLNAKIRQLQRPQSKPDSEFHETLTGIEAFDALLPDGGLNGGTLIEWLSPQGGGGSTLAMALAAKLLRGREEPDRLTASRRRTSSLTTRPTAKSNQTQTATQSKRTLVVIDTNKNFYPPAITNLGVSLSQVVIIRPRHIGETIWAFEQSLRCSGVTITMAWIDHLTDQTFRRLQLATEAGGGVGFLFRPTHTRKQRSWADARFLVEPASAPQVHKPHVPGASEPQVPVTSQPQRTTKSHQPSNQEVRSPGFSRKVRAIPPEGGTTNSSPDTKSAFSSGWGSRQSVQGVPRPASTPTLIVNKGVRSLLCKAPSRQKTPDPFIDSTRRLKVQLLHCRGRIEGGQVELEINDETGDVHLASRLASPATQSRTT